MYNYSNFTPADYDFSTFEGPKVGQQVVDFTATGLDGKKRALSDYFGQWIVLETGSITCPIYESKIETMNELAHQFSDVVFLLLYVREAHPGEDIPQHMTLENKLSCAQRARDVDGEARTILVDDLEGNAHRKYGSMPNSIFVVNPAGEIVFRGDWNSTAALKRVLEERDLNKRYKRDRYSARPDFSGGFKRTIGVLHRAGRQAVWDFVKAFPIMVVKHVRKVFV